MNQLSNIIKISNDIDIDIINYFKIAPESIFIEKVNNVNTITTDKIQLINDFQYIGDLKRKIEFYNLLGLYVDDIIDFLSNEDKKTLFGDNSIQYMKIHLIFYLKQKGDIIDIIAAFNNNLEGVYLNSSILNHINSPEIQVVDSPFFYNNSRMGAIRDLKNYDYSTIENRIKFYTEIGIRNIDYNLNQDECKLFFNIENFQKVINHLISYISENKINIQDINILSALNSKVNVKLKEGKVLRNLNKMHMKYNQKYNKTLNYPN